jgi:hypothetical protein
MPIRGGQSALIAQSLHFGNLKRLEIYWYSQILVEHLHAVDTTNRGCDRKPL